MAKVPGAPPRNPRPADRRRNIAGEGTKITRLPTDELKARDREVEEVATSQHPGGSGNQIYDSYPIWFMTQPRVTKANATGLDVYAVVGVHTTFTPRESDNYYGIWPGGSAPSDADVKAGTGALLHASDLGVPHGTTISHTWADPAVQLDVGVTYSLHWYAEHLGEGVSVRSNTVTFVFQNSAPMGVPYITGTPTVGQALTCNTDNITDPDGITTPGWTYQWQRNNANIAGATGVTYTLTDNEKNASVRVWAQYTDDEGTLEGPLYSSTVGPVAPINYPATGQPAVTGVFVEGQQLTVTRGTVDDQNGMVSLRNHAITWRRDGTDVIPGATNDTYTLQAADVGSTIAASWAFTDDDGFAEGPLWSAESSVIKQFNRAATGKPAISGTVLEGETLTCNEGTVADYNGVPDIATWTFQWYREDNAIAGATARTYALAAADVGNRISVSVWFTDLAGYNEGPLTSDKTIYVPEANIPATGQPVITGTVFEGQTLTCDHGTVADANGLPDISGWTFDWQRGTTTVGTLRTYVVDAADVGSQLRVGVSFTDNAGYQEGPLWSEYTITVPGSNQPPVGIPAITGTVLEGEVLTCDTSPISDPDGMTNPNWSYQWQRSQLDIAGQMAVTYTITGNDVGHKLRVYVHFDDDGGTREGPLYSLETIDVVRFNRPATGAPGIDNTSPKVFDTLTATAGNVADENGLPDIATWTWQWLLDDTPIAGATSQSYVVQGSDYGGAIKVQASFTDNDGYSEGPLTSAATAAVGVDEHLHNFDTATLGGFTHTRDSNATTTDYVGNIVTVTDDVEAYPGGNYVPPWQDESVGYGIQLEEARTNLLHYSNDFTNSAWAKAGGIDAVVGGQAGLKGFPSALITTTFGDTSTKYVRQSRFTTTQDGVYHGYFRYVNWRYVSLRAGGTPRSTVFDFETETFSGSSSGVTAGFESLGDGWYYLWVVHPNMPNVWAGFALCDASGNEGHDPGIAAQIEVAAHQAENGLFHTSYIPSDIAAATIRAATNLSAPFSALSPLPAGGVVNDFCVQVTCRLATDLSGYADGARFCTLYATDDNDAVVVYKHATADTIGVDTVRGGVATTTTHAAAGLTAGTVVDIRLRKSSAGMSVSHNGGAFTNNATDTAAMAAAISNVAAGASAANGNHLSAECQITRFVPAALSDVEIMGDGEDVEGWPTWTEPLPLIVQQPTDIDFSEGVVEPPPAGVPYFSTQPENVSINEQDTLNMRVDILNNDYTSMVWETDVSGDWRPVREDFPEACSEASNTNLTDPVLDPGSDFITLGIRFMTESSFNVRCIATNSAGPQTSNIVSATIGPRVPPGNEPGLIYQSDTTYLGSFTVPREGEIAGPRDAENSGNILCVTDNGSSLFIGTKVRSNGENGTTPGTIFKRNGIAKISIPAIGGEASWLIDSQWLDYDRSLGTDGTSDSQYVRGSLIWGDKLLLNPNVWYDSEYSTVGYTMFRVSLDLQTFDPLYTADYTSHGLAKGFVNGYMCHIPAAWQAALDGNKCLIGNGNTSIAQACPQGFSFFGFDPDDVGVTEPFPLNIYCAHTFPNNELVTRSIPMIEQKGGLIFLNEDQPCPVPNDIWSMGDNVCGICWPENTDTVLAIASHGCGQSTYKIKNECSDGLGRSAAPYRLQMYAFDANDFVRVKNGEIQPHEVEPYSVWPITDFDTSLCVKAQPGGFAYDEASRRIYFCITYENNPEIHVIEVGNLI